MYVYRIKVGTLRACAVGDRGCRITSRAQPWGTGLRERAWPPPFWLMGYFLTDINMCKNVLFL